MARTQLGYLIHGRDFDAKYGGSGDFSIYACDLTLDTGAGDNDATQPKYINVVMGNLLGSNLTKTQNYLAGVYGKYSVFGATSTVRQNGAVVGEAAGRCAGAIVAVLGDHNNQTEARPGAMFKAWNDNLDHREGVGQAGADYGMDLQDDHESQLKYRKADVRMSYEVCLFNGAGAPTDGGSGTGAGFAQIGSVYLDRTNGKAYINGGTKASPTWKLITSAA